MKRIMVVDDDEGMLLTVKRMLAPEGYDVITAVSGRECLMKLRNKTPDCLLIDIMMPEMDGWMLLREIRRNPRVKDVPVIIVTAKPAGPMVFTRRREKGLEFSDYINKPFTKDELIGALRDACIE